MIEVEKKFLLSENDEQQLVQNAEFLSEKVFTDIYYDTWDYKLTSRDIWLRSRDGRFELKTPLHEGVDRLADQYDELESEDKIREAISLVQEESFTEDLQRSGYSPFCICKTMRRKYQRESFIIDLDIVEYPDATFIYRIGEIELMANDQGEARRAIEKILAFARERDLVITPVRGKVVEYLKRIKPEHYQVLISAGVVKDF